MSANNGLWETPSEQGGGCGLHGQPAAEPLCSDGWSYPKLLPRRGWILDFESSLPAAWLKTSWDEWVPDGDQLAGQQVGSELSLGNGAAPSEVTHLTSVIQMCFDFPTCLFAPLKAQKTWCSKSISSVRLFLAMLSLKSALYIRYSLPFELFKGNLLQQPASTKDFGHLKDT